MEATLRATFVCHQSAFQLILLSLCPHSGFFLTTVGKIVLRRKTLSVILSHCIASTACTMKRNQGQRVVHEFFAWQEPWNAAKAVSFFISVFLSFFLSCTECATSAHLQIRVRRGGDALQSSCYGFYLCHLLAQRNSKTNPRLWTNWRPVSLTYLQRAQTDTLSECVWKEKYLSSSCHQRVSAPLLRR